VPDHVHLLVTVDPRYGIHRLVEQIKGRSSRLLGQEFPHRRSRLPTSGPTATSSPRSAAHPLEIVKRYVENQRNL
jgi:putative transposase